MAIVMAHEDMEDKAAKRKIILTVLRITIFPSIKILIHFLYEIIMRTVIPLGFYQLALFF
jgi:hypothetical protein